MQKKPAYVRIRKGLNHGGISKSASVWEDHPKYGISFKADIFEVKITDGIPGIQRYLSSNFKGIGPSLAKKITDIWGTDTLNVLDEDIERLSDIKGISYRRMLKIKEQYIEKRASRDVVLAFAGKSLHKALVINAYKKFGAATIDIIRNHPYMLCDQVEGITFECADRFLEVTEETERRYDRFLACAAWVLSANESGQFSNIYPLEDGGSTGMAYGPFAEVMLDQLSLTPSEVYDLCNAAFGRGDLVVLRDAEGIWTVFTKGMYMIEKSILNNLLRIKKYAPVLTREHARRLLAEEMQNIPADRQPDPEQQEAVIKAFSEGVSLLVGYPGAGKTTTIALIQKIFKKLYGNSRDIIYLAPSGKAAR